MRTESTEARVDNQARISDNAGTSHALYNDSFSLSKLKDTKDKPQNKENLSLPSLTLTDKEKDDQPEKAHADGRGKPNVKLGDTNVSKPEAVGQGKIENGIALTQITKKERTDDPKDKDLGRGEVNHVASENAKPGLHSDTDPRKSEHLSSSIAKDGKPASSDEKLSGVVHGPKS